MKKARSSKKKQKHFTVILLAVFVLLLSACGNKSNSADPGQDNVSGDSNDQLSIVTSIYPIYYMTKEIGGEYVQVTNLISTGVEPHDWSPKSKDLIVASKADLLLYHGVGLETWIDDFQKGLSADSQVVLEQVSKGIDLIDVSESEDHDAEAHEHGEEAHDHDAEAHDHGEEAHDHDAEAHEHGEEAHDHDAEAHDHGEEVHDHDAEAHDHDEEAHDHAGHVHNYTLDPHTWVSPKSALVIAENIKNSLIAADAKNKEHYEQGYEQLKTKLTALDEQYEAGLSDTAIRTIVVSHQAFGYIARDYDLTQVSIMGLSPNAEPRAQDILNISKLVKEHNVKYIFFEELVSDNIAKMLASEAKIDTMVIYSLEGLTTAQEKNGETYLTLMERNLQNLIQALQ